MSYKPPPHEPIAVVGSSCRFAGGATSPAKLWDLLRQPSDLSRRVPAYRFNVGAFYHPDGAYHGTTDAPNAYWLDGDPKAFDAGFFGIAPKEAEALDPQQRLLLETVYEALEDAGYALPAWAGQDVGVYIGAMTADYDTMAQRDDLTTSPYYATGNARSLLANRVSYFYDFRGPSATIDTACSSSLVALHQAVLGLRAGDCIAACVAGVNLLLAPEQFIAESSLHMLSPTGRCRMWDAGADGYARGEGAAVLLLKPLSRALADGDGACGRIQALVRGTGVGSDGRTAGITMPSPTAQAALIRATYRRAGLDPRCPADRCQYFEAHGTGTPVGDPREAQAIHSAFFGNADKAAENSTLEEKTMSNATGPSCLLVGSIKTVIGHTEGAAGVAGILKAILAMRSSQVPPNLHLTLLNPQVASFCTSPLPSLSTSEHEGYLQIPTELTPWPTVPAGQPYRASINSFGFGGTNAHAIVEKYDPGIHGRLSLEPLTYSAVADVPPPHLPNIPLFLSAASAVSLRALAQSYCDLLEKQTESSMRFEELAWRAYSSRTAHSHRIFIPALTHAEAIAALSALFSDDAGASATENFGRRARRIENISAGPDNGNQKSQPKLLGIFTGQGAQWPGMSKHLFWTNQIYRNTIRSLDKALAACPNPPDWTLEEELQKSEAEGSRVRDAAVGQPLCTALQIGLVNLLHDGLGLQFSHVVGHSSGEIAAAYAAGRLSARDAILVAYYRGNSASSSSDPSPPRGGMLAAGLSFTDATEVCQTDRYRGRLCVAASNSPSSTTLSGDLDALDEAEKELKAKGVFVRRLLVSTAYHSHHMAPLADGYLRCLEACNISPVGDEKNAANRTVWISSVNPSGSGPNTEDIAGRYWMDNMVRPVLFREAVEQALLDVAAAEHSDCVIEVGPHSTLKGPFNDTHTQFEVQRSTGSRSSLPYTSLLQRGKRDDLAFSEFLGFLWTRFDPPPFDLRDLFKSEDEQGALSASLARLHGSDNESRLPSYPWDHSQTYFRPSRVLRQYHHRADPPHELLGSRTRDDVDGCELRWRNLLRADKLPWLAHHAFQGQPLLPASAYCIMARDAAQVLLAGRPAAIIELEDVAFLSGIPLEPDGPATEIMFSLVVQDDDHDNKDNKDENADIRASFTVFSAAEGTETPMRKRCTGKLRIVLDTSKSSTLLPQRLDPAAQPETAAVSTGGFYAWMAHLGLQYTGPFRALEAMRRRYNFATATLRRFHAEDTTSLSVSPATLDASLQTCFATYFSPGDKALWTVFLPIRVKKIRFSTATIEPAAGDSLAVEAHLTEFCDATSDTASRITGDLCIFNADGAMEIQIEGLTVGALAPARAEADRELYLHTMMDLDPEDCIVTASHNVELDSACDRVLRESCERVAAYYLHDQHATPWPADTEDAIEKLVVSSPFFMTLKNFRAFCNADRESIGREDRKSILDAELPFIVEEGKRMYYFQQHISRLVQQLAHRYPRMSIFSFTDADACLSTAILDGLGSAFVGYTSATAVVEGNLQHSLAQLPTSIARKVHMQSLDRNDEFTTQLAQSMDRLKNQPLDLVIVSTSLFQETASMEAALEQIRKLMRPGGFLVLVHMSLRKTAAYLDKQPELAATTDPNITPPAWPDVLDRHGFGNPYIKNADQHYPRGFSVAVRQCESEFKMGLIRLPSASLATSTNSHKLFSGQGEKLLIIGGRQTHVKTLVASVRQRLEPYLAEPSLDVVTLKDLDELAGVLNIAGFEGTASAFTSVIMLGDLDQDDDDDAGGGPAILSSLDEARLNSLRTLLLQPDMTMLWVTRGARMGNAENAASFGFTRTIRAEMPSITLQMLDFDQLSFGEDGAGALSVDDGKTIVSVVVSTFLQLMLSAQRKRAAAPASPDLWVLEPEVHIDRMGRRLIPRVLPYKEGNNNFNASRRVVIQPADVLKTHIEIVRPLGSTRGLLRPDRTYILIGITRDMGQSLCTLFVEQGGRHFVLASRSAPQDQRPHWAQHLAGADGVTVHLESLDVTDINAVRRFRTRLLQDKSLPPVGGIVNGAMVLEDRVFTHMDAETFARVMRPKTVGSRNLDVVFGEDGKNGKNSSQNATSTVQQPPLDFFIMTSSFAAIGGHAGQSNYAAANMYMNGLATSRRRRGEAASVLNIGVIYGLGFLHREKDELYRGLEREGYPPISERDLHHMFLQAIVEGRPKPKDALGAIGDHIVDFTTGLSRFRFQPEDSDKSQVALHWHRDPRFSHYTLEDNDDDAELDGQAAADGDASNYTKLLTDVLHQNTAPATAEAIAQRLVPALCWRLAQLLHLGPEEHDRVRGDRGLVELGVDSLVAVEARTWLWRVTGRDVPVMRILGAASIDKLCVDIAKDLAASRAKDAGDPSEAGSAAP